MTQTLTKEDPGRTKEGVGSLPRGSILTLGFGGSVAMWGSAYVCRLPGVQAPGWLLAGLFALCLLGTGVLAGRWLGRWTAGVQAGALTSVLNLLILGSVLADPAHRAQAALWVPGTIGLGALLCGLGALAGARAPAADPPRNWTSAFARVAACATLLLLAVGGLVTSNEAGLAVPDWPNTYASNMFLYPLSRMTGGIYYEHTHRLFGSLVGLTTLALAVQLWRDREERRTWIHLLGALAFVLVCMQGLLGGLRVTGRLTLSTEAADLAPNAVLGAVHGVTAQLFFALLIGICAAVSTTWRRGDDAPALEDAEADEDPDLGALTVSLSGWLVALVVLQLVLGALVRHFDWSVTTHITGAVLVLMLAGASGLRAWGLHDARPVLPRVGLALLIVVSIQFLLGFGALAVTGLEPGEGMLSSYQAPVTTLHQTCGALVLAAATLQWVWARRWLTPSPASG